MTCPILDDKLAPFMKKKWIHLSLAFSLSLTFLYFFFKSVDWMEVLGYITDVNPGLLVIVFLLTPTHFATRALRWEYLLRHDKKEGTSFYNRFAANVVGFTVTMIIPGRLGELVKPLFLARKEAMKKGFVIGTIVVERIFDLLTMCFLLGIFLIAKPLYSSLFSFDEDAYASLYLWGKVGITFALILLFLTLLLYFLREKALAVIAFFLKPVPKKIAEKILELFREFIEGLKFFHNIADLVIFFLLSNVVWISIVAYYWLFFFSYKVSVPLFVVFPFTFLTMVGASIPTPGMIGGYHYFSKLGMTSFLKIDPNQAVSMTIVVHAIQVVVTCLLGYVILWKEGLSLLQIKKLSEDADK